MPGKPSAPADVSMNLPPGYRYAERLRRYRNASTGRFVARKDIYRLLDVTTEASADSMRLMTQAMAEGQLSPSVWMVAMQRQLQRLHVQNAALGAGGFDNIRRAEWGRIDEMVREEIGRLVIFGSDVLAGKLSAAQIANRVHMYAGTARREFFLSRRRPEVAPNQMVIERRTLGVAEHCPYCVHLAELGWQPYGVLPHPGESSASWDGGQCFSNCRCHLETRVVPRKEGVKMLSPLRPAWIATGKSFFANIWPDWSPFVLPVYIPAGIKGGPGSGYHNEPGNPHRGRPGQRGGSLPSDAGPNGAIVFGDESAAPESNDEGLSQQAETQRLRARPFSILAHDVLGEATQPDEDRKKMLDGIADRFVEVHKGPGTRPKWAAEYPELTFDDLIYVNRKAAMGGAALALWVRESDQGDGSHIRQFSKLMVDFARTHGYATADELIFSLEPLIPLNSAGDEVDIWASVVEQMPASPGLLLVTNDELAHRYGKAQRDAGMDVPESPVATAFSKMVGERLREEPSLSLSRIKAEVSALTGAGVGDDFFLSETPLPLYNTRPEQWSPIDRMALIFDRETGLESSNAYRFGQEWDATKAWAVAMGQRASAVESVYAATKSLRTAATSAGYGNTVAGTLAYINDNNLWETDERTHSKDFADELVRDASGEMLDRETVTKLFTEIGRSGIAPSTAPNFLILKRAIEWESFADTDDFLRFVHEVYLPNTPAAVIATYAKPRNSESAWMSSDAEEIAHLALLAGNAPVEFAPLLAYRSDSDVFAEYAVRELGKRNPQAAAALQAAREIVADGSVPDESDAGDIGSMKLSDHWQMQDWSAPALKDGVAKALSESTRLTYDEANAFVNQWALSSNGGDMRSFGIQEVAAEVFGVELSQWQQRAIDELSALRAEIETGRSKYLPNGMQAQRTRYLFDDDGANQAGATEKLRYLLAASYNDTQKFLSNAGIEYVRLYRGVTFPSPLEMGASVTHDDNPLSSWTFDRGTASNFGENILSAIVPARNIFSTPFTGQGCLHESEIIVIGQPGLAHAFVERGAPPRSLIERLFAPSRSATKSYPAPHRGRPDERGGSLPRYGEAGTHDDPPQADQLVDTMAGSVAASSTQHNQSAQKLRTLFEAHVKNAAPRVWTGKPEPPIADAFSKKLETGAVAERVVRDLLSQWLGTQFRNYNEGRNNAPIDVQGDHLAIEVKAGRSSNSKGALHWRVTLGEISPAEKSALAQMTPEEKRQHNLAKTELALFRKNFVLDRLKREFGVEVKPMTVAMIFSPDMTRGDIYAIDGFHAYLAWNKYATEDYYVGTLDLTR